MASETADVVVVGGGVIGVCAAYYLAAAGARVTVLEQREIGSGSSYGNAGLVVPSHSVPLAAPGVWWKGLKWMLDPESPFYIKPRLDPALLAWLWRFRAACTEAHVQRALPLLRDLNYRSLSLFRELAGLGFDFGFRQDGALAVYRTAAGYAASHHEVQRLEASAIAAKLVDAAGARDLEPSLAPDVVGGIFYPDDAHLVPDRFVRGLARAAEGRGVALRPGTEVLGFQTAGPRVVAVETTRGSVAADTVVLAAGSWAPGVARTLGLRLPIQPAKGYSLTYERPSGGGPRLPLLAGESRFAITPMGEHLRFAGTLELAGLDFSIDRRRVDAIRRAAARYLTGLEDLQLREIWRGLRPCTPDGLPLLGRPARWPNVILATGHAMVGVSLGPITGKLVAQLVAGSAPEVDLALLGPDRFA